MVTYGFGDASGKGFGSGLSKGEDGISYRIGVWTTEESEESSNWREFTNVVETLEEEAASGKLDKCILYFFTDNSTVESALYKGTSSSRKLLELVIRVRLLETKHSITLHVVHVSGKRMIAVGVDGISRGLLNEGVMAGEKMLSFIPLHLTATERSPTLLPWIQSWVSEEVHSLSPYDWFQRGHDIAGWSKEKGDLFERPIIKSGVYGWFPPPAAADAALEQLRIARIKRQDSTHIFACPRLMTPMWLRQLYKASDIVFTVPLGTSHGNSEARLRCMQWVGNCKECGSQKTWTQGLFCANFGNSLGNSRPCRSVWCPGCYSSDPNLKFHTAIREGEGLDPTGQIDDEDRMESVWRTKQSDRFEFAQARRGDHLMVQFECDGCIFFKLRKRLPISGNAQDQLLLGCIRRVVLDSFWSRARTTVERHAGKIDQCLALSKTVGLSGPYLEPGPLPPYDHCGYEVAIQMVLQSRAPGKYSSSYQQWDTIRKIRSCFSNQVRASGVANATALSISDLDGKNYQRIGEDSCAALWFQRFLTGCKRRMGQDWRPDRAISHQQMSHLLATVENRIQNSISAEERARWIFAGTYFAACYVASLRGPEGLLMELAGLRENFETYEPEQVVVLALRGKVKGEHHVRDHLLPVANETKSGIQMRTWIRRTLAANHKANRTSGPAFCDENGRVLRTSDMNEMLHDALGEVFDRHPTLFLADIKSRKDIEEKYHVYRSFRRGSDSRALAQEVNTPDIEVVNRWAAKEKAGPARPGRKMVHHYSDINLLLPCFLRYTSVM